MCKHREILQNLTCNWQYDQNGLERISWITIITNNNLFQSGLQEAIKYAALQNTAQSSQKDHHCYVGKTRLTWTAKSSPLKDFHRVTKVIRS